MPVFMRRPRPTPVEGSTDAPWKDDELTAAQKRTQHWRYAFFGLLVITAMLMAKDIRNDRRSLIETQLVVVDAQGQVVSYGPPGAYTINETMLVGWLAEWVEWVHTRPDERTTPVIRTRNWAKASQMVAETAAAQWEADRKAAEQAIQTQVGNPMRVTVRMKSYQRESDSRYRLTWEEVTTPTYGHEGTSREWRGLFEVKLLHQLDGHGQWQQTQGLLNQNPRVVYIVWYDLSPQMEPVRP